jgi:hypothetical protein
VDVFDAFDRASAPATTGRGRTVLLAAVAAAVALLAAVGGVAAVAAILLPDSPDCTASDLADGEDVRTWVRSAVDLTAADLDRQVRPLGCGAGGERVGARAGLIDDAELDRMRAVLGEAGCLLSPDLSPDTPATCSTLVGDLPVLVEVSDTAGAPEGDYEFAVTRRADTAQT